jgi:hypothetical protein
MLIRVILIILFLASSCRVLAAEPAADKRTSAENADRYHILKKIKLGGDGSWDYLTMDSASRRLYIGRANRVMVVDIDAEKVVGEIPDMQGVHGVTLVSELQKGFITCGKEDLVRVFDLSTLKVTAKLPTGKKPDASLYDPSSKRVFVFNNGTTTATVIDANKSTVLDQIELGGAPESGVADRKGKVYVNLEDKSKIAVIDSKKMKLLSTWSLAPGEEPTGLAIDSKHRRLFSGCHNKLMVILDADTGKVVASLPIGKGVDAAGFDPQSQNAFSSNGDGTLTVIHEKDKDAFAVLQNVETQAGARTMALDAKKQQVWLVTATPKEAPEAQKGERRQRTYVPDSFTAIVVGK